MPKTYNFSSFNLFSRLLSYLAVVFFLFFFGLYGYLVNAEISSASLGQVRGSYEMAADAPVAVITVDEPSVYAPGSSGYAPDWGMHLTKGYAPYPIFFQGWQSTPREDIVKYEWDFGDGSAKFYGFNAAHVYETPGNYTVSLRVLNSAGVWSGYDSINVEIMSRAGKRTYYVDSQLGDDSNSGLCETPDGKGCGPWRTAQKAFASMPRPNQWNTNLSTWIYQPGDRILFKRGQAFEVTSKTTIGNGYGTGGYYFGAYGSGAKPLIQWKGASSDFMLDFDLGSGYIGFIDLQFQFYNETTGVKGIGLIWVNEYLKNILFLRDDFYNPDNGVWNISGVDKSRPVSGLFMVDSTVHNNETHSTSVTQIAAFGLNSLAILNSTFDQSGNHTAYFGYIDKAVIKDSVFSRPAFGRAALRISGESFEFPANNIYVADNYFLGWVDPVADSRAHNGGGTRYNYNLVNFGPNNTSEKMLTDIIFENNVVTNSESLMDITNGENIKIRNNIFVTPDVSTARKFAFSSNVGWETRPLKNVDFVGNTFVLSGNVPTYALNGILQINDFDKTSVYGDRHQNVRIMNNIIYSNGSGRAISFDKLDSSDVAEFTINNNIYYLANAVQAKLIFVDGIGYTLSEWQTQTGQDLNSLTSQPLFQSTVNTITHSPGQPASLAAGIAEADAYKNMLKLSSGSPAINAGANLGADLYYDFFGTKRPQDAATDIGFYELASASPPPPICSPDWICTAWSPTTCPSSGTQTRTCTDKNNCGTTSGKPATTQTCTYVAPICSPDWICTAWSPTTCPSSGTQTRTCTDKNNCGTTSGKPATTQTCTYVAPICSPDWICTAWSVCNSAGRQIRTCTDKNNCGTTSGKPATTQTCTYVAPICSPDWICTAWSVCNSAGRQIRTCTDNKSCGTASSKPSESQACTYIPPQGGSIPETQKTQSTNRERLSYRFYQGRLVKLANDSAIYHIGPDNKRRLFSNEGTYWTWYSGTWKDQIIETVSQDEFDNIAIDKNVTIRPGASLIKFANSAKIYAVLPNDTLCTVTGLYNNYWRNRVILIQNSFEMDYTKDGNCQIAASSKYPDGSLIQYKESAEIYYILDGYKHLVSPEVFKANNFSQANTVINVPTTISYPTGWDLEKW
ncbi:MAG TPA: PKD domain-containing protein [bacterium]|nr:PKD domain-containing protein [bacterium]